MAPQGPSLFESSSHGLFSEYFLAERLPQQPFWSPEGMEALRVRLQEILAGYEKARLPRNEENTRNLLLDPVLEALGYAFHRETAMEAGTPDYLLFASAEDRARATKEYEADKGRFYGGALTLLEAKYWDRRLENVVREDLFSTSDASAQTVRYLMDAEVLTDGALRWGILTNGRTWRLFWNGARSRVTNFYEVDLPEVLAHPHGERPGSFDALQRFVRFFEPAAFRRDGATALCRLDAIASAADLYAQRLEEDLRDRIFDPDTGVFIRLARGFAEAREEETGQPVTEEGLEEIREGSLLFLYRLLFILYAESRDLLPVNGPYGRYSLRAVGAKAIPLAGDYGVSSHATDLWTDLLDLFKILEKGDKRLGVPVYNGGLFKEAKPGFLAGDRSETAQRPAHARQATEATGGVALHYVEDVRGSLTTQARAYPPVQPISGGKSGLRGGFFASHAIRDRDLAPVLMALTRVEGSGGERRQLDYKALGVRQLGSLYEGLLEYRLRRAEEPLYAVDQAGVERWVRELPPGAPARAFIPKGRVYLETDSLERRTSGSYYTPQFIVAELVRSALEPVLQDRLAAVLKSLGDYGALLAQRARARSTDSIRVLESQLKAREDEAFDDFFSVRVLDPAMGSGHFLVEAADHVTSRLVTFLASPEVAACLAKAPRGGDGEAPENPILARIARQRAAIVLEMKRQGIEVDEPRLQDSALIKRMVLKRCLYGVDLNPLAVELAKLSLWLDGFTLGAPLSFLDHHLKAGNSLLGTRPEAVRERLEKGLFTGGFASALAATETYRAVDALSDATLEEVHHSLDLHRQAEAALNPFRRILDADLAAAFGEEEARHHLDAVEPFLREDSACVAQAPPPAVSSLSVTPEDPSKRLRPGVSPSSRRRSELTAMSPLSEQARSALSRSLALARSWGFFHWPLEFPDAFYGSGRLLDDPGFDAVVTNPPWERAKLQENEFFAKRSPAIALAPTAAERKRRIAALQAADPALWAQYEEAKSRADALLLHLHESGDFPLLGRGDTNLYAVFVERALGLTRRAGRCALVVPSGIATDKTTSAFFRKIVEEKRLGMLLDFENRKHPFPAVDSRFKFTLVNLSGGEGACETVDCAFFLHDPEDLADPERRFPLRPEDFARFNPNTLTTPIFRSRKDAEITKTLYEATPVLLRYKSAAGPEENPWGIRFLRMFDMTNDSGFFKTRAEMEKEGFWLGEGNRFTRGKENYLPLYEGKMVQLYDHRAAGITVNPENLHRPAQPRPTTPAQYADPAYSPEPQFWVPEGEVDRRMEAWEWKWLLSFKDICSPTNVRTCITAFLPLSGVGNNQPLLFPSVADPRLAACFLANMASLPFDFAARQKVGGQHLNFFIVEQLPVFPPDTYERDFHGAPLRDFILPRVLELTFTAHDMAPFARDMGFEGPPFPWDEDRRLHLKCQLDALFALLYGLERDAMDHALSTFPILREQDIQTHARYRTRDLILAYMAAYAAGNLDAWVRG